MRFGIGSPLAIDAVRAWDVIFGRQQPPEWLQVKLTDKTIYSGRPVA